MARGGGGCVLTSKAKNEYMFRHSDTVGQRLRTVAFGGHEDRSWQFNFFYRGEDLFRLFLRKRRTGPHLRTSATSACSGVSTSALLPKRIQF